MSAVSDLAEGFEGTAGNNLTTSTTKIDSFSGGAAGDSTFNADSVVGSTSAQFATSAGTRTGRFDLSSALSLLFVDLLFKITVVPGAQTAILNWFSGTSKIGDCRVVPVTGSTFDLELRDNNTSKWTSGTHLNTNTWYRLQEKIQPGSATGHRLRIYNTITNDTATQDSGDQAATANSQTVVDNVRLGVVSTDTMTVRFDDMKGDNAALVTRAVGGGLAAGLVGPSGVIPYDTFQLTASATGGTGPYSYSFSQLAGTSTSLSGSGATRTGTAPAIQAGDTLTYRVTVTDAVLATATADFDVVVSPQSQWTKRSGVWVPVRRRVKVAGSWV